MTVAAFAGIAYMRAEKVARVAVIVLIIALITPSVSVAEMRVLESNVPEYQAGLMLPDNTKLNLPAGGRVKVLLLPSNETKVFSGPNSTAPAIPLGGMRGAPRKQD